MAGSEAYEAARPRVLPGCASACSKACSTTASERERVGERQRTGEGHNDTAHAIRRLAATAVARGTNCWIAGARTLNCKPGTPWRSSWRERPTSSSRGSRGALCVPGWRQAGSKEGRAVQGSDGMGAREACDLGGDGVQRGVVLCRELACLLPGALQHPRRASVRRARRQHQAPHQLPGLRRARRREHVRRPARHGGAPRRARGPDRGVPPRPLVPVWRVRGVVSWRAPGGAAYGARRVRLVLDGHVPHVQKLPRQRPWWHLRVQPRSAPRVDPV